MTDHPPALPGAGTPVRRRAWPPRGTLARQLVIRVVALVCVLALALGALSLVVVGLTMLRALDRDVADTAARDFATSVRDSARGATADHFGKPLGTISIRIDSDNASTGVFIETTGAAALQQEDLEALLALPRDNQMHIVRLPSYGTYRVYAGTSAPANTSVSDSRPGPVRARSGAPGPAPTPDPATTTKAVITGLPMQSLENQLGSMVVGELAFTALAIVVAVLATGAVVTRSLRPLNELADTAREVSTMELDKGTVDLNRRVDVDASTPANEVTRLGTAFNVMLDHVGEALNAREASENKVRKFVADASHELRNPLAAIRGYAEITRRQRDQVPPDAAFALGRIEAESERMSSLVEDMLLLARLDNRRGLELRDVDLTEQLIHAVSDARVAGPNHVWGLDLPDEPVDIRGDAHRLYQVIVNLLTNARVHTPAGTKVTTGLRTSGTDAIITVTDDGPGIDPELQPKLFDRFVRADASRVRQSTSSTGLGLAIVKSVVQGHGGTVSVRSVPGHTEFTVTLPVAGPSQLTQETYKGA